MPSPRRLLAGLHTVRVWVVLGVLAPLGMLLVSALMLYELRQEMWSRAEETSRSLLQVIEADIVRNVEIMDLALQGMVAKLENPRVAAAPEELRHMILFDRVVTAEGMGILVLFDEHGNGILNSHYPSASAAASPTATISRSIGGIRMPGSISASRTSRGCRAPTRSPSAAASRSRTGRSAASSPPR